MPTDRLADLDPVNFGTMSAICERTLRQADELASHGRVDGPTIQLLDLASDILDEMSSARHFPSEGSYEGEKMVALRTELWRLRTVVPEPYRVAASELSKPPID